MMFHKIFFIFCMIYIILMVQSFNCHELHQEDLYIRSVRCDEVCALLAFSFFSIDSWFYRSRRRVVVVLLRRLLTREKID
ncbi:hypothetical protein ACP275_09G040100 [Erythranthe tilingii]